MVKVNAIVVKHDLVGRSSRTTVTWIIGNISQLIELWGQIFETMNSGASFLETVASFHFEGFAFA